jgi:hypothetical protein
MLYKDILLTWCIRYMDFTKLFAVDDLFATELAMIFSFHVGLTDSVM